MSKINDQFEQTVNLFPQEAHEHLRSMIDNGSELSSAQCVTLASILKTDLEQLMLRLLSLAKLYAIAPISDFRVGAVARGISQNNGNEYSLYLGANMEFQGQALNQSVHAEQAAVINAWQHGAKQVKAIAVSANPCGHCRQFLKELDKSDSIMIITHAKNNQDYYSRSLPELLPHGFGPKDLNFEAGMMAHKDQDHPLTLKEANDDALVNEALRAALQSYAPYTGNLAGCAIQNNEGDIYIGRYAENAAFNLGVSPLQAAAINMNMDRLGENIKIKRVILVEKITKSSQYLTTEQLLKSLAPNVSLEYFGAE